MLPELSETLRCLGFHLIVIKHHMTLAHILNDIVFRAVVKVE